MRTRPLYHVFHSGQVTEVNEMGHITGPIFLLVRIQSFSSFGPLALPVGLHHRSISAPVRQQPKLGAPGSPTGLQLSKSLLQTLLLLLMKAFFFSGLSPLFPLLLFFYHCMFWLACPLAFWCVDLGRLPLRLGSWLWPPQLCVELGRLFG